MYEPYADTIQQFEPIHPWPMAIHLMFLTLYMLFCCPPQQTEQAMDAILSQEKQMEVCEVCGAFLIVGDAQSRVDDHLMGKQHMGYAKIKATIEEIKVMSRLVM